MGAAPPTAMHPHARAAERAAGRRGARAGLRLWHCQAQGVGGCVVGEGRGGWLLRVRLMRVPPLPTPHPHPPHPPCCAGPHLCQHRQWAGRHPCLHGPRGVRGGAQHHRKGGGGGGGGGALRSPPPTHTTRTPPPPPSPPSQIDVFSFGVLLWECLTAQRPWAGHSPMQIIFQVGVAGVRPPLPPTCPPFLAALVRRCWAAEPGGRPPFAEVLPLLLGELARVAGGAGAEAGEEAAHASSSSSWVGAGGGSDGASSSCSSSGSGGSSSSGAAPASHSDGSAHAHGGDAG